MLPVMSLGSKSGVHWTRANFPPNDSEKKYVLEYGHFLGYLEPVSTSDYVVDVLENVAAPNKIKKVLKNYEPMKKMIYQSKGQKVRALFDQDNLPRKEQAIRNRIKSNGWWMR